MRYSDCYNDLKKIIKREFGYEMAMSSSMAQAIEVWSALMENEPAWADDYVHGNEIPATVASEVARLAVLEFESDVVNDDYINEIYHEVQKNLGTYLEFACGKGGMILKPYINGDEIIVSCVQADSFFPIRYNADMISTCAFLEQFREGKEIFTRIEIWDFDGSQLEIINKAFKSTQENRLGNEIDLESVEMWQGISPRATFECDRMPFGYFRTPLANTVDNSSPLGISIFHRGIQDIARADRMLAEIDWEYKSKETAIHISDSLLKTNDDGQKVYPEGGKRLYRVLDYFTGATDKPLLEVFSPEIRNKSLFDGLNQIYKAIELKCYLSYGVLSDPNNTDKTAEEIRMSKQRSYTIVTRIQEALETCLIDMLNGIKFWGNLNGTIPLEDLETSFEWGDSVLTDKDKDRQMLLQEVSAGIRTKESYLMEVYGITEEEAKALIPQTVTLFGDVNA